MNVEAIKKGFDAGIYLHEEALAALKTLGMDEREAKKYLDGMPMDQIRVRAGAGRSNLLVIPQT